MFNKKQLDIIKNSGYEGLSLKATASRLGMTFAKFNEEYQENEEAQLAFETGQAELEIEVLTVAKTTFKGGDKTSFDFLTKDVLSIAGKTKPTESTKKKEKVEVPSILLTLGNLLSIDDEELARKQALKQDTDNKTSKQVKLKNEEENDE